MLVNNMKNIAIFVLINILTGCSSIQSMGNIGPKKLGVYVISHNDFLAASRMVVVLDKKGNVAAYSGGTTSGLGTVAMQTTGELVTAGAIVYGARTIQKGLQSASVKVKGVPKNIGLKADLNVNATYRKVGP